MSSANKYHLNGSTVLSLNERFTRMQSHGDVQIAYRRVEPRRSRSRSRSRTRVVPEPRLTSRTSPRNRSLLAQLDQKHILRTALKLKRKSLKMKPRNVIDAGGRRQLNRPATGTFITQNKRRQNRRPNSVAKQIETIKADLLKNIKRVRQLSRSNSKLSLNEQLAVRARPRLKRNNNVNARITQRARSRSRSRMGQDGSNSGPNIRGRSVSRQRSAKPIRLKRSNSQIFEGSFQTSRENGARPLRREQSKSRTNIGQRASVNSRLQIKRQNTNRTVKQVKNLIPKTKSGRITKNFRQNQQKLNRNRLRNQSARQMNNQQNGNRQNKRPFRGKGTRGQVKKTSGKRDPTKSKEELDAELDQYMVNTMPNQDQDVGIYSK